MAVTLTTLPSPLAPRRLSLSARSQGCPGGYPGGDRSGGFIPCRRHYSTNPEHGGTDDAYSQITSNRKCRKSPGIRGIGFSTRQNIRFFAFARSSSNPAFCLAPPLLVCYF